MKKWKDEYYFNFQRYAPISQDERRSLKTKGMLRTIENIRNKNQASDKDMLANETIEVILVGISEKKIQR